MSSCSSSEAELSRHHRTKIPRMMPSPPVTKQFGVSLVYIQNLNVATVDLIPPVVRDCVNSLLMPAGLETEGIFRLRANPWTIEKLKYIYDYGFQYNFTKRPHLATTLIISFFRDLSEPVFTYELYCKMMFWTFCNSTNRTHVAKRIIYSLPTQNYAVIKYLLHFLLKVNERSSVNKSNIELLAFVFAPNLAWPNVGRTTIQEISCINSFLTYLLLNFETIFTR